jgi:hypothetical protein
MPQPLSRGSSVREQRARRGDAPHYSRRDDAGGPKTVMSVVATHAEGATLGAVRSVAGSSGCSDERSPQTKIPGRQSERCPGTRPDFRGTEERPPVNLAWWDSPELLADLLSPMCTRRSQGARSRAHINRVG